MNTRWIAELLCLLYLSASTLFSAIHHHENAGLDNNQQCTACSWHHDGSADAPELPRLIIPPEAIRFAEPIANVLPRSVSYRVYSNRGPPASLL